VPPPRPALGEIRASDLELCEPLTPDVDETARAAIAADAQSRGDHIECQLRQRALLGIVRELIERGVLMLRIGE